MRWTRPSKEELRQLEVPSPWFAWYPKRIGDTTYWLEWLSRTPVYFKYSPFLRGELNYYIYDQWT